MALGTVGYAFLTGGSSEAASERTEYYQPPQADRRTEHLYQPAGNDYYQPAGNDTTSLAMNTLLLVMARSTKPFIQQAAR